MGWNAREKMRELEMETYRSSARNVYSFFLFVFFFYIHFVLSENTTIWSRFERVDWMECDALSCGIVLLHYASSFCLPHRSSIIFSLSFLSTLLYMYNERPKPVHLDSFSTFPFTRRRANWRATNHGLIFRLTTQDHHESTIVVV